MKATPWLFGSWALFVIAGCGGERRNHETGAAAGAGTDTSTMQAPADTGMRAADTSGMQPGAAQTADTARSGARIQGDTNKSGAGVAPDTSRTGPRIHPDSAARRSGGDTSRGSTP